MPLLKQNYAYFLLIGLAVVSVLTWYAIFVELGDDKLRVVFLDVGQGDAVFIESPSGGQMLIDGGPDNKVLRVLSEEMPFYDRSIDIVLATHPDTDHIGGLPAVMDRYEVDTVITPGVASDSESYEQFSRTIKEQDINKIIAKRGLGVSLGKNTELEVLFPDRDLSKRKVDKNSASVVSLLEHKNSEFLFVGDAPKDIEKYLTLLEKEELECDVLKVGHHGSKTSSSEYLLGFSSPEYAVISAGEDNSYGHPHENVVERLKKFDLRVLKTFNRGNIEFVSGGEDVEIK